MSDFPYTGLRPFKREETDIFFGRDELSNQLIERLDDTHFLAVVGLSGCGKSSLVRAGLLAGLDRGLLPSAGIRWRIAECTPSDRPFFRLANALLTTALKEEYTAHFTDDISEAEIPSFLEAQLRRGPLSLSDILKDSPLPPNTNLLLVIDQFEELFRYYRKGQVDDSAKFVRLLLNSSKHPAVYVVITMRSEFMGDCALFHGLPEAINQGLFLTPRLTRQQLHQAIEGPAKVFGDQIEATLTNLLLNEMSPNLDEKGGIPDKLPVLQHALMRMWSLAKARNPKQAILTLKDYEKIGQLTHALSQHADKVYTELANLVVPANPQKVAEILFRRLCERDSARRDTRSPARLDEIARLAEVPSWQEVVQVIDMFRKPGRHFLMPPLDVDLKPDSMIDISHESLIQHWKRLKDWSKEKAKSADMYRRLEDTARRWKQGQAELWRSLDLENALAWYEEERPNALWASRYGQDFELAMRFLKESENKQKQKQRKKEELERRERAKQRLELKQMRKRAFWAITGMIVMVGLSIWVSIERNHAVQQEQIAISEKQKAEQAKLDSQLNNAAWLARFDDYKTAKTVLGKIKASHQDILTSRRHAYNLLNWFSHFMGGEPESEYVYKGVAALSAIAINNKHLAVAGENGTVALFDVKSGQLLQLLQRLQGHESHVKTVVFHPQAEWLASAGYDKRIIRWSLSTGKQIQPEWQTPDKVWTLAVSPDGNYLASGGKDNDITLWDVKTGSKRIFTGHEDDIKGLAFSSNGKLASASYDGTVRLWDIATGEALHKLIGHTDKVYTVAFSHDDKWLASGSKDTTVRLWEVNSGKPKHSLLGHKKGVFGVSFSADGRYVVSASDDLTLRMWDTESGVTMRVLQGHTAGVNGVVISAGKIFSVSDDATVRRWNTILPYQQAIDFAKKPLATAIAPDGNSVAVGFKDGTLRLYALPETTEWLWEKQTAHADQVRRIAFNSDGSLLASASADKKAKLWQAKDGKLIQTFTGHEDEVNAVAFAPNDNILATASFDGKIGLFTIGTNQKTFYPAHDGKDVNTIAFDASDIKLLSTGDNDVRLWHLNDEAPTLLEKYSKSTDLIWSALSPNGEHIASVGRDQLVHVYSTIDQSITYRLKGHENTIYRVIFSPTGQQIATVSSDATLRVWDLRHGMELFSVRLPTNSGKPVPLKDFDFRCMPKGDNCWIAVPLTRGKLMLYQLENIYR
jgi:WD40 repeat protein